MRPQRWVIGIIAAMLCLTATTARAETAADSFAQGEKLLASGEFASALQSFAAAARADRQNSEYQQHYMMVRRIVDLRSRLEQETGTKRWENMARALRAFYLAEQIHPELLKLDQEVHRRLNTADSAAMLAETQLTMDLPAEAVKTLADLAPATRTEMAQSLLAIALARSGKAEEARQIAAKLTVPVDADSSVLYAAARVHAATGDSAKALALLRSTFEATSPSALEGYKLHAKNCAEFAGLASSPKFARVMETRSKLPELKCSGGSSCAGCPMSGKCPKSQAKQ